MAYRPLNDMEWNYLESRFVALARQPSMRALFDRSLPGSDYTPGERRRYRAEIFTAIREYMASSEAYPNPYFELTWFRSVQANPILREDLAANRSILWDAYFRSEEPVFDREAAQERWEALTGRVRNPEDLVTITDEDLEHSE